MKKDAYTRNLTVKERKKIIKGYKDMTPTPSTSKERKIKEKLLVESWYNRSLPCIDLDHPTADGYCNEYQMTQEAWAKSIRKDLKKYYKKL